MIRAHVIRNIGRGAFALWELFFSCLAIVLTAYGFKDIWSEADQDKSKLFKRIFLSLFYFMHLTAMFFALGVGEFLISAPVAGVIVAFTTLFSDMLEKERNNENKIKRDEMLASLHDELKQDNFDFQQNLTFFENWVECQDEIDILKGQKLELIEFKDLIEKPGTFDTAGYFNQLKGIAKILKEKCDDMIKQNQLLDLCHDLVRSSHGKYAEVVQATNDQIQKLAAKQLKIEAKLNRVSNSSFPWMESKYQETDLLRKIDNIKVQIKDYEFINQYFYRLSKSKAVLQELEQQLSGLDAKYRQASYKHYSHVEIRQLINLEREMLNERIKVIKHFVEQALQSRVQADEDETLPVVDLEQLVKQQTSPDRETLSRVVQDQLKNLDAMLQKHTKMREGFEKFIRIIIQDDPKNQTPKDISKIIEKIEKIYQLNNEIELSRLEESQNRWSANLSMATAICAIGLYFSSMWMVSTLFLYITRAASLASGGMMIFGFFHKRNHEKLLRARKTQHCEKMLQECKLRAGQVKNPKVRKEVNRKLADMMNHILDPKQSIIHTREQTRKMESQRAVHYLYNTQRSAYRPYASSAEKEYRFPMRLR